jgi:hypothetical protein
MSYIVRKLRNLPTFSVKHAVTKIIHSLHDTKKDAIAQMKILNGVPTKITGGAMAMSGLSPAAKKILTYLKSLYPVKTLKQIGDKVLATLSKKKGGMFNRFFGKKGDDNKKNPERKTIRSADEIEALQNNTEDMVNEWDRVGIKELYEDGVINAAERRELLDLMGARDGNRLAEQVTGDPQALAQYRALNEQINHNINMFLEREAERHIEGKGRNRMRGGNSSIVGSVASFIINSLDYSSAYTFGLYLSALSGGEYKAKDTANYLYNTPR